MLPPFDLFRQCFAPVADELAAVLLGRLPGDRPLHLPHRGPVRPRPRAARVPGARPARDPQGAAQRRGRPRLPARGAAPARRETYARQGLQAAPLATRSSGGSTRRAPTRGARRILGAVDAEGRTHAALYVVWDERTMYALMSARNPEVQPSAPTHCCTGRRSASRRRSRASSTSRARWSSRSSTTSGASAAGRRRTSASRRPASRARSALAARSARTALGRVARRRA